MNMARALYHWLAAGYYRWALNGLHPAHRDAAEVQMLHAMHRQQLDHFLRGRT
jgi:hypothetical protein